SLRMSPVRDTTRHGHPGEVSPTPLGLLSAGVACSELCAPSHLSHEVPPTRVDEVDCREPETAASESQQREEVPANPVQDHFSHEDDESTPRVYSGQKTEPPPNSTVEGSVPSPPVPFHAAWPCRRRSADGFAPPWRCRPL